jgi:hypothetical protein
MRRLRTSVKENARRGGMFLTRRLDITPALGVSAFTRPCVAAVLRGTRRRTRRMQQASAADV